MIFDVFTDAGVSYSYEVDDEYEKLVRRTRPPRFHFDFVNFVCSDESE